MSTITVPLLATTVAAHISIWQRVVTFLEGIPADISADGPVLLADAKTALNDLVAISPAVVTVGSIADPAAAPELAAGAATLKVVDTAVNDIPEPAAPAA